MTDTTLTMPQIEDDETLEAMHAVLASLQGSVDVFGHVDDKPGIAFRVAGYRTDRPKPLLRPHDPEQPEDDFRRTHYSSMSYRFARLDEAQAFEEQFG